MAHDTTPTPRPPVSHLDDCYLCAREGHSLTCRACEGVGLRAYCAWCHCYLTSECGCECGAFRGLTAEDAIVRALGPTVGWSRAVEDARDIVQSLMCEAPEAYADTVRDESDYGVSLRVPLRFHRRVIADALDRWWSIEDGYEDVVKAWRAA